MTKTIPALMLLSIFTFGTAAKAADAAPQRGQVAVSGPAVKAVVAGPIAIHAYSGFSGGAMYAVRAVTGTDADCRGQAVEGTRASLPADSVIDFRVGAGQVACLETTRGFELLWHAQKEAAPATTMIARRRELGDDRSGQLLAELDAPLVERVDVPDDALDEDLVLVERDEPSERARIQLLIEE